MLKPCLSGLKIFPLLCSHDTVQAAKHPCYVLHHSYGQEQSAEHAGNQRASSPSAEIRGDSPAPQSGHEEVAATLLNAIVAYQTP